MGLSKEQVSIAVDLRNKCSHDTVDVIYRAFQLCDDSASKAYIGCGAVCGAGAALAAVIGSDDLIEGHENHLSEATLFALIFGWLSHEPLKNKTTTEEITKRSKVAWEGITGKSFDASLLCVELRKYAK